MGAAHHWEDWYCGNGPGPGPHLIETAGELLAFAGTLGGRWVARRYRVSVRERSIPFALTGVIAAPLPFFSSCLCKSRRLGSLLSAIFAA
jgi:hypothetical protein